MQQHPSPRSRSSATITKLAIASTMAIGATAIATPARAAFFYDSQLNFGGTDINNFFSSVAPIATGGAGTDVSLDFSSANTTSTFNSSSTNGGTNLFAPLFISSVTSISAPTTTLTYGSNVFAGLGLYNQPSTIVFTFSNGITLTAVPGSTYTATVSGSSAVLGTSASSTIAAASYFTDTNGDKTYLDSLSITANTAQTGAANYGVTATTTKTPEPLTIIGTLLGTATAVGLRKKLKSTEA